MGSVNQQQAESSLHDQVILSSYNLRKEAGVNRRL